MEGVAFGSVMCDWMAGSHHYPEPVRPIESGRILRIDRDGVIEYEARTWEQIRCPSSDTSIRIRCDGRHLQFSGNIGRFQRHDNIQGLDVAACVERWCEVLGRLGVDLTWFGTRHRQDTVAECGTYLTRVDLAGNFEVSDYAAWCRSLMLRPIGRRHPREGRYGPTWGYDAKRSNWWKAKVYDKQAEQEGLRRSRGGRTLARFEVQLGSEYLKREGLDAVGKWNRWNERGEDMATVIYGRFAAELLRDSAAVEDWSDIPPRLRAHAILWRDGVDLRTVLRPSQFYAVKAKLKEFGIDISIPCNVVALSQRCRTVDIRPLDAVILEAA